MQKIIETNLYKINYSDSLQELAETTIKLLQIKIDEYKKLFNIQIDEQIVVNYFDNLEQFREFIYEIRGERKSLPKYAKGTYDNGMINAYIESNTQLKRLYTSSHELFHILYMKYILKNDYSKRIIWYDEGMAQYMSGEKDKLKEEEKFKEFYQKAKENTKVIPNLNELEHGNSFYNENYNGYDLSYLSIKYLSEILDEKEFINLMSDFNQIKEKGKNIVNEMFEYYNLKYKSKNGLL
jgi:hypothetical protein